MSTALNTFTVRYGVAILYFASFLLAGVVLDLALGRFLRSVQMRNLSRMFSAVIRSLRGITSWALGVIGLWMAFYRLPKISGGPFGDPGYQTFNTLILGEKVRTTTIQHWLTVATLLVATIFLARIAGRFIDFYTESDSARISSSSIFTNLVKAVIYIIGVVFVLNELKVSITPIITTLGIGGVAIGLALQPTLGNLFAGIQIVSSHQIEPGDFVRIASGDEGTVEDVTWSNTTIRKVTSELIVVPNSVLSKEPVINFSRSNHQHTLVVPSMVAPETDVLHLERVVRDVANETMRRSHYTYKGAAPAFRLTSTTGGGISFNTILPIISYRSEGPVRSEFLELLLNRFTAEGIKLARPLAPAPVTLATPAK
ncbi:MAG: mechanosensitive ion channel family protein [Actinomycetia bacterium]|nr:mechanosensitive ion channel family protein [Actinomycetes bacterium]